MWHQERNTGRARSVAGSSTQYLGEQRDCLRDQESEGFPGRLFKPIWLWSVALSFTNLLACFWAFTLLSSLLSPQIHTGWIGSHLHLTVTRFVGWKGNASRTRCSRSLLEVALSVVGSSTSSRWSSVLRCLGLMTDDLYLSRRLLSCRISVRTMLPCVPTATQVPSHEQFQYPKSVCARRDHAA